MDDDKNSIKCKVEFQIIEEDITGPIYVYYQLDNFYQNHRRYVKSRDNEQLAGAYKNAEDLKSTCDPIYKVEHLWSNQKININGKALNDSMPAIPCGLVAKSVFNDTFELYRTGLAGEQDEKQSIEDGNIAWSSDVEYKFDNMKTREGQTYKDLQWQDMKDRKLRLHSFLIFIS
jgi:hypothetical protein